MIYHDPIIPGFYPDPSICRVKNKYYLVTSSFNYFPGVPLFESEDLVNWQQIGHVLTRKSQLELKGASTSGGIYAPTIRYHEGRFYMVTTNVDYGGNFYVWTDDIHGEWSDPIYVEQGGIDPSLYFENGHAYFMSNGEDDAGVSGITQCEIDIETGQKLTPSKSLWQGAGGRYLEGPHLYKINGYYYLLASEGGTEYGHMLVYARSQEITGPYQNFEQNPVLTNRNLGGYQIQGCGHGDLVSDPNGNWWLVHLGFRQLDRWLQHHITGREVYLVPVTFDQNGWFSAGVNKTTPKTIATDRIDAAIVQQPLPKFSFENTKLKREWVFLRNPDENNYQVGTNQIKLHGNQFNLNETNHSPTAIFMRQREHNFKLSTTVTLDQGEAGVSLYMSDDIHYDLVVRKIAGGYALFRRIRLGAADQEQFVKRVTAKPEAMITLKIAGDAYHYQFAATIDHENYQFGDAETKYLSSEVADNFTGVMIGLFATDSKETFATFSHFSCRYNINENEAL